MKSPSTIIENYPSFPAQWRCRNGAVGTSLGLRTEGGNERSSCRDNARGAGWLATVFNRVLLRIEVDLSWEVNPMKI
jgi:hypothetical protein